MSAQTCFAVASLFLGLLLGLIPQNPLFASSVGGGGGGGGGSFRPSKPKVDRVYELGARIYNGKVSLAQAVAEKQFLKQVAGLDSLDGVLSDKKKPELYRFAGRLSDAQYKALQRFVSKQFRVSLVTARPDASYARAARWVRSQEAPTSAIDEELQVQQMPFLHRLGDAAMAAGIRSDDLTAHAVTLDAATMKDLVTYARRRLGVTDKRLSQEDAHFYQQGLQMVSGQTEGSPLPEANKKTLYKQRAWLRKLSRKLPEGHPVDVEKWAGQGRSVGVVARLWSPAVWNFLTRNFNRYAPAIASKTR